MVPVSSSHGTTLYRSRGRRLLVAGSVVLAFLVTLGLTQEPDPVTHTRSHPSEYLWLVVPFALLTLVLAARALRTRMVTTDNGLQLYRVTSHDFVPWERVAGFEVHPTPTGRMAAVVARLDDERVLRVGTYLVRGGDGGRPPAADALCAALASDRQARLAADSWLEEAGGRGSASGPNGATARAV